jgi:DNA-binding NtrC family response regulator
VEHALIVCEDAEIQLAHLPSAVRAPAQAAGGDEHELLTLQELERAHIARALKLHGGHRARVARALGISERNLYRKLNEHGLG